MNYEKMYHLLFNAITDALEQIRQLTRGERSNAASAGKSRFAQI